MGLTASLRRSLPCPTWGPTRKSAAPRRILERCATHPGCHGCHKDHKHWGPASPPRQHGPQSLHSQHKSTTRLYMAPTLGKACPASWFMGANLSHLHQVGGNPPLWRGVIILESVDQRMSSHVITTIEKIWHKTCGAERTGFPSCAGRSATGCATNVEGVSPDFKGRKRLLMVIGTSPVRFQKPLESGVSSDLCWGLWESELCHWLWFWNGEW